MSKRQWMALLMLFLAYLLLGAGIFYVIEGAMEIEQVQKVHEKRIEINALLHQHIVMRADQHEILEKLTAYCGKSVYNYTENETDNLKWDFYNSFYFAYTVVSTIGYGNLVPTTMSSKILMIFYALLGIPMNGILLSQLGDFFSVIFIRAHNKYKSYKEHHQDEYTKKLTPLETRKAGLAMRVLMYLAPGFVMFIFFPASVISYFEETTYDEAVYYAFVTLTTIGFGDIVAGQDNTKSRCHGPFFILYKAFLIVWIVFGLGYMVMIITFITRGMRSKKIVRLEHKLAMNLKQTQSKIWGEFNKEVNYFRRVFNELQLSKVKRVYVDEYEYEVAPCKPLRSISFPDLRELVYGGMAPFIPPHPRRRANSEVAPVETPIRARVVSETDLQRIDKTATFATHAIVQPAELLARLVNILGYIPPHPDDDEQTPDPDTREGVQGFSDKEILSNEQSSNWKLGSDRIPFGKLRSRAASEVCLDTRFDSNRAGNHEWTWSGPAASNKIQEIIKARQNSSKESKESKSLFPVLNLPKSVQLPKWFKQLSNNKKEGRTRNSVSVGDLGWNDEKYLSNVNNNNEESTYFTHTGVNLPSSLESSNLLEETSLADFLRALTVLHTRVGAVPDEFVKKPQRKMGTASLTPPKLPSLLTLFSPSADSSTSLNNLNTNNAYVHSSRRFSLRPTDNLETSTPSNVRRSSMVINGKPKNRRFSLRPVSTPLGSTPQASPHLSGLFRHDQPTVSATYKMDLPFENLREPLVHGESTPGISSPIAALGGRRFSLRPTQTDIDTSMGAPNTPVTKGVSRWRAGMLQKQINQMNVQKRVRALSLSDVNAENFKSSKNLRISPLALDADVKTFGRSKDPNKHLKTVTIVSPSLDDREKLQISNTLQKTDFMSDEKPSVSIHRMISTSCNPFAVRDLKTVPKNPFIDVESQKHNVLGGKENFPSDDKQTVFDVFKEGKITTTIPTMTQGCGPVLRDINANNDDFMRQDKSELSSNSGKSKSLNEKSDDIRTVSRGFSSKESTKNPALSISHLTDPKKPISENELSSADCSSLTELSAAPSKKSSSVSSLSDKARFSIDYYK